MQDNKDIEVIRKMYDAVERGDLDAAVASFADDAEIEMMGPPDEIPYAGTYRGPEGMRTFLEKFAGTADILEFEHDEFYGADGLVTVFGHERARPKQTGREWSTRVVDTYKMKDGKIQKFTCGFDTAAVANAYRSAPS